MRLFRCSSLGKITVGMSLSPLGLTEIQARELGELIEKGSKSKKIQELTEKRDKIPELKLSAGAKTYIEDVWYGDHFEFQKSFHNKYVEKGNLKEDASIKALSKYLGFMTVKNEIHLSNDFIQGTPDIRLNRPKCTIDTKNVYYPNGLSFFQDDEEKKDYVWQIHGYNFLEDKEVGFVARILMNPPAHILEKEVWTYWKNSGNNGQPNDEFRKEVEEMFNFERLPIDERVNLFRVDTTENEIKIIQKAVELANVYYNELTEKFGNRNKEVIEFFKINQKCK
jgi:hypothetical protein